MKKIFECLAISRIFWIVCFALTVWLMAHNGVWTTYTPAPTEITE